MFTPEMMESVKKVEATRAVPAWHGTAPYVSAEEKDAAASVSFIRITRCGSICRKSR